ncbi:MAG: hypothetical protein UY85_C0012G0003 [Candidatus Peribacteria bacterium GW2011_GWB1_54_5]|nr:MAG: hypothetical protein UY87_C0067G0010 [Candidatus Peribacteria bacterium GW2011_GWC2_54_8]KKW39180.1 MAG: hypothetical protein UY85_C0012G0003 [Candidatus Peribacteria bacterium GW2011_GWB1_54_5]KKW40567.1 MAG: hypothetical protein UY90_C0077G0009 [Candidatus Peregrinibacteria bacterium GW2011_GWA2_54_9]
MKRMLNQKDSWLLFAQGYFKTARLACNELLTQESNPDENNKHAQKNWISHYYTHHLVPAIIFNTKHGIECYLKYLLIMMTDQLVTGHDLEKLFRIFNKKLTSRKWYVISSTDEHRDKISSNEIKKQCVERRKKLRGLIRFFARNKLASSKLRKSFSDKNNELFRYPEMLNMNKLDYEKFLVRIREKDLQELLSHIDDLERFFNDMGYFVSVEEQDKHPTRSCFNRLS